MDSISKTDSYTKIIIALSVIIAILILFSPRSEYFSSSGLSISNKECDRLADVYYRPRVHSKSCRQNFKNRICGQVRRDHLDYATGNYETNNSGLLL